MDWLGRQPYEPMWRRLQARALAVAEGVADEIIWACEHEPIYTTGRRGVDNRLQKKLNAPFVQTDRGGETTFHGPGQLMLYPVLNLRLRNTGARDYLHLLEQSCIDLLGDLLGIRAERRCGLPGVWTDTGKIAAIGLRISNGVAYHGMALNINVDMNWFSAIAPCGASLPVVNVTDLVKGTPKPDDMARHWVDYMYKFL